MTETLYLRGVLRGHEGWVNSIATTPANRDMIISAGRDKKVISWTLTRDDDQGYGFVEDYGYARRALTGHSHFVEDLAISEDGLFALSCSWDREIRLWDLNQGVSTRRFVDHKNDVLSVAFSPNNRQIVSGSRDRSIKLWNTLGQCKYTITEGGHDGWVSCVRFSPSTNNQTPVIVSGGWDKQVKVWDLETCKLKTDLPGHQANVNTVTVSPDGSLCASGGKDGVAMLWDLNEGKYLYDMSTDGDAINALVFSPNHYWLCAATDSCIMIWDLESKSVVDELRPEVVSTGKRAKAPACLSLAWSASGNTLFAGYTDNMIRVWQTSAPDAM